MIKKLLFILLFSVSALGFSQEKSIDKLSAAPNPFQNNTKISFNSQQISDVYFVVKNILGKTVHKETVKAKKGSNVIRFSKGDLKAGIYIYSIQNDKKVISKRFVIQ